MRPRLLVGGATTLVWIRSRNDTRPESRTTDETRARGRRALIHTIARTRVRGHTHLHQTSLRYNLHARSRRRASVLGASKTLSILKRLRDILKLQQLTCQLDQVCLRLLGRRSKELPTLIDQVHPSIY